MTSTMLILKAIKPSEHVTANMLIERTGLARAAVGGTLWRLLQAKQVLRVGWGMYRLNPLPPAMPKQMLRINNALGCKGHIGAKPKKEAKPPAIVMPIEEPTQAYKAERVEQRAMRVRPALQTVWGV